MVNKSPIPGIQDEADSEDVISILNDLSQDILTNSWGACKEEQESDSSDAEEGNKPTGDPDGCSSALLRNAEEVVEEGPPPLELQCIQNGV